METWWKAFINKYSERVLYNIPLDSLLEAFWEYSRTDTNRSTNESIAISDKIINKARYINCSNRIDI
jgi:hypothetical protein